MWNPVKIKVEHNLWSSRNSYKNHLFIFIQTFVLPISIPAFISVKGSQWIGTVLQCVWTCPCKSQRVYLQICAWAYICWRMSGWFAGQLHKQLACLRIWGFGGEGWQVEKKTWSSQSEKSQKTQKREKLVCADSRFSKILPGLIETVIKQATLLNLQRRGLKITRLGWIRLEVMCGNHAHSVCLCKCYS